MHAFLLFFDTVILVGIPSVEMTFLAYDPAVFWSSSEDFFLDVETFLIIN